MALTRLDPHKATTSTKAGLSYQRHQAHSSTRPQIHPSCRLQLARLVSYYLRGLFIGNPLTPLPAIVDLGGLSTQQLSQVKKQLDEELEHLTSSFTQLRAAQAKFRECLNSIATGVSPKVEGA